MNRFAMVCSATAGAVALVGIGFQLGRSEPTAVSAKPVAAAEAAPLATENVVQLPPDKLKAAAFETQIVQRRPIASTRLAPARLQYDDRRHIALKVLTDGVLTKMLVKPGDDVGVGQPLAQISSPEVGTARANLLQRESERQLAEEKYEWAKESSDNIKSLIAAVRKRTPFDEVQKQFGKLNLGEDRERLLAAYSKFLLNESLLASLQGVGESGAVASKVVKEREADRQAAQATLDGLCEIVAFEARMNCKQTAATAEDAQRRSEISRQHLHALIGQSEARPMLTAGDTSPSLDDDGDITNDLSEISVMTVRAPFPGTIEDRSFSANERVKQGDELFILADTQTLWVKADIRERDWRAISLQPGQKLSVSIPALPNMKFDATLLYVGREVSTDTNAVPLVAVVDNPKGLLRPGLFAHVALPLTDEREVLAVPAESVVEHESHKFVFVMEGEDRFQRVNVAVGESTDEWVEIRKGLKGGEKVVSHGAFLLKSELLLEAEE